MEQIREQLPYGVTINEIASMLQQQLIIKHPDIVVYAVNDVYIYSVDNLETLRNQFMYENLEMVRESDPFWVLRAKSRADSCINIYININSSVQPKVYTFFRLDAVNAVLRV